MNITTSGLVPNNIMHKQTSVSLQDGEYGLCLLVDNNLASAKISLFGGHILSFIPNSDKRERLWLSENAIFDGKTPIRGGIPICWPWFSSYQSAGFSHPLHKQHALPSHGFARTQYWQLHSIQEEKTSNGVAETVIELTPTQLAQYDVYLKLHVLLRVRIGEKLEVNLISSNESDTEIEISQALHSYFTVNDINAVSVKGVTQDYDDKPTGTNANKLTLPYLINQEVDRIHRLGEHEQHEPNKIQIINNNAAHDVVTDIENQGNDSVVVWNPWQEKSITMKDMADTSYITMLCIEAANTKATTIKAGDQHTLTQIIS